MEKPKRKPGNHAVAALHCMKLLLCLQLLLLPVSCTQESFYRTVEIIIPEHPWEAASGTAMWYSLKWNDGSQTKTLFVDNTTRRVFLDIPRNCTVYVCAYPLGNMLPWGTGISPLNGAGAFVLDQDRGFVADVLLNSGEKAASLLNFERLCSVAFTQTDDLRNLDTDRLLQDVINGKAGKNSIKVLDPVEVSTVEMYSGQWIPESTAENAFTVSTDDSFPALGLCQGIHRYFCVERNLEVRIVVSSDGVFSYERTALLGGVN